MSLVIARTRTLVCASLLCLALGVGACNTTDVGFGIALTLDVDSSVSDAALATVTRVHLVGRGDETTDAVIALDRPLARREKLVYRPGLGSRSVALRVTAEDQSNTILAAGDTGALTLAVGKTTAASVTLSAGAQADGGSDGGSDDGGSDDGGSDDGGTLTGTVGDDVLFAGPSGWLRGEQFEQVLLGTGAVAELNGTSSIALNASADVGWVLDETPDLSEGLETGDKLEYLIPRTGYHADAAGAASAYTGLGHFAVDTSWIGFGGVWIRQAASTKPGEHYLLQLLLSNPQTGDDTHSTIREVIEILWQGQTVGRYSQAAQAWTGVMPVAVGGNRVTLTFDVVGAGAASTVELRSFGPISGAGVIVDAITLASVSATPGWVVSAGAGSDLIVGTSGDDTLSGRDGSPPAGPPTSEVNGFVYTMSRNNGDDVITDFRPGSDRLIVTNVLDTYNAVGLVLRGRFDFGGWNATTAPDASRFPNVGGDPTVTTPDSDRNLSFHDVLAADSLDQAIVPSAATDGSLKLRFVGPGGRGLGSVTLRGVPFTAMTSTDDGATLRRLMGGSGYIDPQVPNPAASDHILFLTTDGVYAGLLARVVH